MYSPDEELAIREDAFKWLNDRTNAGQFDFTRMQLSEYNYAGKPLPLMDRGRGIRNPAQFRSTLSIMSTLSSQYADQGELDALLRYDYRAGESSDNLKLKAAVVNRSPMIYFREVRKAFYVPYFPVYAIADDPIARTFLIAMDEAFRFFPDPLNMTSDEKRYAERVTRTRLHQPAFRAKVMHAYRTTCAVCMLKHSDLLDAAHIVPDFKEDGFARVTNGLALCKIHHAAYDRNLLGITPNFKVRINAQLLDEVDGPMLRHGVQDMHNRPLTLPRREADRPSQDALAVRFAEFSS